jgi:hypothetical protein
MRKIISMTAFAYAAMTMFVGAAIAEPTTQTVNYVLSSSTNKTTLQNTEGLPEWVKFLAPIVAGLLGKLIDVIAKRKEKRG